MANLFEGQDIINTLETLDNDTAHPSLDGNKDNVFLWLILKNTKTYKKLESEGNGTVESLNEKYGGFLDDENFQSEYKLSDKYDYITKLIISLQNSQMLLYDAKEIARIYDEDEGGNLTDITDRYYEEKKKKMIEYKTNKLRTIRNDKWNELSADYDKYTQIQNSLNIANASQDYLDILTKDIYNTSKSQLDTTKGELTTMTRQSDINMNQYYRMRSNNQYLKYTLVFFCIVIIWNGLGNILSFIPKNIVVIVFGVIVALYLMLIALKTLDRYNRSPTNFLEKKFPLSDYKVKELGK